MDLYANLIGCSYLMMSGLRRGDLPDKITAHHWDLNLSDFKLPFVSAAWSPLNPQIVNIALVLKVLQMLLMSWVDDLFQNHSTKENKNK